MLFHQKSLIAVRFYGMAGKIGSPRLMGSV